MNWIKCEEKEAPKNEKFLFKYHYGIGLGEYGQCYTTFNGNSERTHEAYILILHPSEWEEKNPFEWSHERMIEMEVSWMPLPS
jgi:hypothetical protein